MPDEITLDPFHIGRFEQGTANEVVSKRADSQIEAGEAVQLLSGDKESVETYDGNGDFYGIALFDMQADQDFRRASNSRDRARYDAEDPVPILRVGSTGYVIVEFEESVTEADELVIDDSTGNFRPASTGTTPVTAVTNGVVEEDSIQRGANNVHVGAVRLRPTE